MEWSADSLGSHEHGTALEWVLADGRGGYAAGSATGRRTRRAHGLLTVATEPPLGRYLLLAELDARLTAEGGDEVALSSHGLYADGGRPDGFDRLTGFRLDPFPTWSYAVGGATVERRVFLLQGEGTAVVLYTMAGSTGPCRLDLRPLLAFRRPEERTWYNDQLVREPMDVGPGRVVLRPYDALPELHLAGALVWVPDPVWGGGLRYPDDEAVDRGDGEDLFCPGRLVAELREDAPVAVVVATAPREAADWQSLVEKARTQQEEGVPVLPVDSPDERVSTLVEAVGTHLVARGKGVSVLGGFPGPTDSARDALIALPGLCLVQQRHDEARRILETFVNQTSKGLLPSHFPEDGGPPVYEGVDTSLWFFHAAYKYLQYTEDFDFARGTLFWPMVEILGHLQRGTMPGVRTDRSDELIVSGEDGRAWTWMDARLRDGSPATPRAGKCVEVNALFHSAACVVEWVAQRLGKIDLMRKHRGLAGRLREAFNRAFWNPKSGGLYDCIAEDGPDEAVRPNQILAAAMPFPLLTGDRQASTFSVVERSLLTPFGLRSLAQRDAAYVGTQPEDPAAAAATVHQGAAYPWLLGPFLTAAGYVRGGEQGFTAAAVGWLAQLLDHAAGPGAGHLPDHFDGDAPHAPRGYPTSAWAESEVLRAYVEVVREYPTFNVRSGA